jgi:Leucine-rich repeat (LRR) protein
MKAKHLETLTLGNNKGVQSIPDDIYLLNSLENLDISNTGITTLPKNFYALSNLKYLNLANLRPLNSPIVKFGREINICNFENTLPSCYQQETCKFILGYSTKYKECSDYEIQQIHDIDTVVFRHVDKKYNVVKNLLIIFLCFIAGVIIYRLAQNYIKQQLKKKKENEQYENDDNDINSKHSRDSIDVITDKQEQYFRPEEDTYLSTPVYDPEKEQYSTSIVSDQQFTPYNTDITNYNNNNPLYNANPVSPASPVTPATPANPNTK